MLHYFMWNVKIVGKETFLVNSSFWIQVMYSWEKKEGEFFVYPYFDDQRKTFWYFAFDSYDQKEVFEMMLKVSWVWPKTAFQIVQFPWKEIKDAVDNLDAKFFQAIPWIGQKLAKKIVLELKGNFQIAEALDVDQDQKLFKSISKSGLLINCCSSRYTNNPNCSLFAHSRSSCVVVTSLPLIFLIFPSHLWNA